MTTTRPAERAAGWARAARSGLAFRTVTPEDQPFLLALYASTRTEELAPRPWTEDQKAAFLSMQAHAQQTDYSRNYPEAQRWVIERGGRAIGRLYLDQRGRDNHILDISLLPEARGKGWGGGLIADLIDEAAREGNAVTIYVEGFNPAKRLYDRLGFRQVHEREPYLLMRREGAVS